MSKMRSNRDLSIAPETYWSFSALLRELLVDDSSFKAEYLAKEFESKLLDPRVADSPEVRRERAITKWLACEDTNRSTSIRLMHADEDDILGGDPRGFPVSMLDVLATARRYIQETLGTTPDWEELKGSFSGGASTSIKRGVGTIARKYAAGKDVTEAAIKPFLRLSNTVVWATSQLDVVRGNVMFTVPKSSTIDRCACKEPEFNMYVQKAIGDSLRRRLKRAGIDLNDQSRNQRLAQVGSKDGSLATLDLSSASDSVTRQLVILLLPEEWFYLMDDVRSPFTIIDGEEHENVMFSSMGNGFTFELESLIFWALCRACAYHFQVRGTISIYGDDIICPSGLYEVVVEVLAFCGFKANAKKSFAEGPFRESCGAHWHNGTDVAPFYVKEVPVDVSDWCLLLNHLREWAAVSGICDPRYYDLWSLFAGEIPEAVKGHWDLTSRSNLVSPGRPPIAKVILKLKREEAIESSYSHGAYLHWLDKSQMRTEPRKPVRDVDFLKGKQAIEDEALVTSRFQTEGKLVLRSLRREIGLDRPQFPQELERSEEEA